MNKIKAFIFGFLVMLAGAGVAQIVPSLPYNLTNGTIADANQVMANFNQIVSSTNTNAATAGANTNITALLGLTTPLSPASGGSSVYTGGTSGGSANAQTVLSPTPTGYTVAVGRTVIFIAGFTNSGPTTLNVNSTGALNIFQKTTSGISALVGGEIVAGQVTVVNYDGTQYQLIDAAPQSLVPACTTIDYSGHTVPSGYLSTDGTAVSRTTYATLFACLSRTGVSATTTATSTSVVVADSSLYKVGWFVGGTNVTCNSTITAIPDGTHITISAAAGGTGATTLTIGPIQQGDCSTTFTLPGYLGRATVAADTSGAILTSATCTNPATTGTRCGTESVTLATNQIPALSITSISVTSSSPANYLSGVVAGTATTFGNGGSTFLGGWIQTATLQAIPVVSQGTGAYANSSQQVTSKVQPIALVTKAIKF